MDGGVDRAEFDHLGTHGCDEATIGGAAAGGGLGIAAGDALDAGRHGVEQLAWFGQERQARQCPVDRPVQFMLVENRRHPRLQAFDGGLGREAEVEQRGQLARDHVGGAGAGIEVGDLEAGGWEERIAFVPMLGSQFRQGRGGQVDRVARQMRVGHMALFAAYGQLGAQRTTATVLDHVTQQGGAGRFADDAPVQALVARFQALDHRLGAVVSRAFLVAGDQKRDLAAVVRVVLHEALAGDDHGRQAALHVGGATATEHAVGVDQCLEGFMLPLLDRAGRHHVGVAGKTQYRAVLAAVGGPEVVDVFNAHRLQLETDGAQTVHHLRLAIGVDGGDRGATDQVAGQLKGRRELGRGRHGGLRGKAGKSEGRYLISNGFGQHGPFAGTPAPSGTAQL
ncbi:hypothetical protein D3C79_691810 [compost metagenome]